MQRLQVEPVAFLPALGCVHRGHLPRLWGWGAPHRDRPQQLRPPVQTARRNPQTQQPQFNPKHLPPYSPRRSWQKRLLLEKDAKDILTPRCSNVLQRWSNRHQPKTDRYWTLRRPSLRSVALRNQGSQTKNQGKPSNEGQVVLTGPNKGAYSDGGGWEDL